MSNATAAPERRSVSTTSKSSTCSRIGRCPRCRKIELRTVRTTSIGCSSPNSQARLAPVGSPAAQLVGQPSHLRGETAVLHHLHHQLRELCLLLRGQGVHQPLGGGGPAGERVDELLERLWVVGEEVAVALHEVSELLRRVL